MANTLIEFDYYEGATLTVDTYPLKSDTADATADTATEQTNRKGKYRITVTEALTGIKEIRVKEGGIVVAVYWTEPLVDDTGVYLADDRRASVEHWRGTAIPDVDTAGYPKVTIKDGTDQGEILTTSGKIDRVTLVDTNTDMRGTDGAYTGTPPTAAAIAAATEAAILNEGDATALLAAIGAKVEEFLINEGDATATLAAIATAVRTELTTELAHIDADISSRGTYNGGAIVGNITGDLSGSVGSVTNPVTAGTVNDKTGYALTSGEHDSIASALLDLADGVETDWTLRESIRIVLSALAGKATSNGSTSWVSRDMADTKDRITATTTTDGSRTAVTRDAS